MWHDRRVADSPDGPTAHPDTEQPPGARIDALRPPPPAHVVEPEQPSQIRRSNDALRLVGWAAFTGLLLLLGDVALGTTSGLEEDLTTGITRLPDLILTILALASNLLLLLLPPLILADLAIRRRWRTIAVATAAGITAWLLAYAFSVLGPEFLSPTLLDALTTSSSRGSGTPVAFPLLTAVVALASVDGLRGRPRLAAAVWGSAIGFIILLLFDQSAAPLALAVSASGGRTVGLAFRYGFGTVNPRPSGAEVAQALTSVALPLAYLKWDGESDDERHYLGSTLDGRALDVRVIDRDRRSAGLLYQLYRRIRVQGVVERPPTWSVRRAVDQAALPVLAARRHGVRTPDLIAAASVTSDSAVLAFEDVPGLHTLENIDVGELDDPTLADLWEQVRTLHRAGIAHEELHAGNIALDADGRVWLLGLEYGEIAADQMTLRIDDGELLVTTALIVGADRAVRGALQELTAQRLGEALPLLQTIALSRANRKAVKANRDVLQDLRDAVVAAFPSAPTEPVRLERMRPRTVVAFFAFTVAVTILLGTAGRRGPGLHRHRGRPALGGGGPLAVGIDLRRSRDRHHQPGSRCSALGAHLPHPVRRHLCVPGRPCCRGQHRHQQPLPPAGRRQPGRCHRQRRGYADLRVRVLRDPRDRLRRDHRPAGGTRPHSRHHRAARRRRCGGRRCACCSCYRQPVVQSAHASRPCCRRPGPDCSSRRVSPAVSPWGSVEHCC